MIKSSLLSFLIGEASASAIMHPEFQLREEHFLVIESNTDIIKAGPADSFKSPSVLIRTDATFDENCQFPFKDGFIEDWESMERLWAKVLAGLNVKRSKNHSPVLLTIPSKWTRQDRERIVKIFFEKFNVPGLYIAEKPLATLYGYGQFLDGVVIDFGADEVSVYPVVEAQVLYPYIASVNIGTLRLKEYLKSLLLADPVFVQEFGSSDIPSDLLDHLFQHVVEVSIPGNDPVGVPKVKTRATVEYQGKKFTVGEARLKALDPLFNPKLVGEEISLSLPELVVRVCKSMDMEKRSVLMNNIMLAGSFCTLKGLQSRLEKEFDKYLPLTDFSGDFQPKEPKFGRMPDYLEPYKEGEHDLTFLGAAQMAKNIFPDMRNYLTKLDYNQYGPNVINVKGY